MTSARPAPDFGRRAEQRQTTLTKPPGSLGRLEGLAVQLARTQRTDTPSARPVAALLFAADHPVARHGVSAYPQAVTAAMLRNLKQGGAAASVMARSLGVSLTLCDVGVLGTGAEYDIGPEGDITTAPAMSPEVYARAWQRGAAVFGACSPAPRVLVLGELGIGNTTLAAAVAALILGEADPCAFVGAGTGATGATLEAKRTAVRQTVARVRAGCERTPGFTPTPAEALRQAGGRELVAALGAATAACEAGVTVLVDGFIITVALLPLWFERPDLRPQLIFAHSSAEAGHDRVLRALGVAPLLSLGLRLGEGTGALTAVPLLDLACALHNQMATFAEAAVPEKTP